jgi:hypothetical protein
MMRNGNYRISFYGLSDFPISVAYFVLRLPIPLAEAVIGPIWWFLVPIVIFLLFKIRKNKPKENS